MSTQLNFSHNINKINQQKNKTLSLAHKTDNITLSEKKSMQQKLSGISPIVWLGLHA